MWTGSCSQKRTGGTPSGDTYGCVTRVPTSLLVAVVALATAGSAVAAGGTIERTFRWQGKVCAATFATPPAGSRARLVLTGQTPYLRVTRGERTWESHPRSLRCREARASRAPGRVSLAARGAPGGASVSWTVPSGGGRGLAVVGIELRGTQRGGPLRWDAMVPLATLDGGAPGRRDSRLIELQSGTWRLMARATNNALLRGALSRPVSIRVR